MVGAKTATATETIGRSDLRRHRAELLAHAAMKKIRPFLDDDHSAYRDAFNALYELFSTEGIEILSDYDRQSLGLPPRGPDGWTIEEIIAIERRRLEVLTKPIYLPAAEV